MITTRRLTLLLAVIVMAIAPGCKNQSSDISESPAPAASSPAPSATVSSSPFANGSTPRPPKGSSSSETNPDPNPSEAEQPAVDCNNAQTQADINICAQQSYQTADKQLNQTYQRLRNSISSADRQELQQAEQAWIEFRDANCDFESSQFEGGSIQPTIRYGCMEQVTKERTTELQRQLESPS